MSEVNATIPGHESADQPSASNDAILRLLDRPVLSADLDAGASLAGRPVEQGSTRSVRVLLFRIGHEIAALPIRHLRRATLAARPIPIPHRGGGVLRGLCNIRGELVLCADLHRLLGLPACESITPTDKSPDSRRMVVIGPPDNAWAFEVDTLFGVESVDPAAFREPPLTVEYALADYTSGVTEVGDRCVTILDAERVLSAFRAGLP